MRKPFRFKQFKIYQDQTAMKVGTDGVLLGAWMPTGAKQKVLDIGTGTGVIAIMAAQRNAFCTIDAIEIDKNAYQQALENINLSPWKNRIELHHLPIQHFQTTDKYDLIVSNPPYFKAGTKSNLADRHAARHTVALTHEALLTAVAKYLAEDGQFAVILPTLEALTLQTIAPQFRLYCNKITQVYPKKDKPVERHLMIFERQQKKAVMDSLVIQFEKRNDFTPEYIALTKAFYTIMED